MNNINLIEVKVVIDADGTLIAHRSPITVWAETEDLLQKRFCGAVIAYIKNKEALSEEDMIHLSYCHMPPRDTSWD